MLLLCLHSPLLDILGDKGDGDSCGSLMVVKWRRQSSLHLHPLSPSLKCRHLLTTLSRWLVNGYTWAICWKIGKLENYIFAKLVPIIVNFFHTLWNLISDWEIFFVELLWLGLSDMFGGLGKIGWKLGFRGTNISPISLSKDFTVSVSVWNLDIEDVGSE